VIASSKLVARLITWIVGRLFVIALVSLFYAERRVQFFKNRILSPIPVQSARGGSNRSGNDLSIRTCQLVTTGS